MSILPQYRSTLDAQKAAALQVCTNLLGSLKIKGSEGRDLFVSTLDSRGQACHARASRGNKISYEDFVTQLPDRIDWDGSEKMEEAIDGEPSVLVDHDIAMVWTPYWFKNNDTLTHVGTNCFTLVKEPSGQEGEKEWKIVGITDTARPPTEEEVSDMQ